MTLIDSPPADRPGQRLLTIADHAALPTDLPSGPVKYELDCGRLIIMSPPGRRHGKTQGRIVKELISQGEELGLGEAGVETGLVLRRDPDTVRIPDVFFIAKRSFPIRETREGYIETPADIAVEVRSKNDTQPEIDEKVREYLDAGVCEVWIIDPAKKTVAVHRASTATKVLAESDTLTVEDIMPGFLLPLSKLFRD